MERRLELGKSAEMDNATSHNTLFSFGWSRMSGFGQHNIRISSTRKEGMAGVAMGCRVESWYNWSFFLHWNSELKPTGGSAATYGNSAACVYLVVHAARQCHATHGKCVLDFLHSFRPLHWYPHRHSCEHFWSPLSPDLNPCDSFVWNFMKEKFSNKRGNIMELRAMIPQLCVEICEDVSLCR
jgi:hypothetical protein